MIQPHEAAALTAALARSIDQRAADLTALLADPAYRQELNTAAEIRRANLALYHLFAAEQTLRELAAALAEDRQRRAAAAAAADWSKP